MCYSSQNSLGINKRHIRKKVEILFDLCNCCHGEYSIEYFGEFRGFYQSTMRFNKAFDITQDQYKKDRVDRSKDS